MRSFNDMLDKQMQDEEFRREYEAIQTEMDANRAMINAKIRCDDAQSKHSK